jgi:hypothetical protein
VNIAKLPELLRKAALEPSALVSVSILRGSVNEMTEVK